MRTARGLGWEQTGTAQTDLTPQMQKEQRHDESNVQSGEKQERPEDQFARNRVVELVISRGTCPNASRVTDREGILQDTAG